MAIITHQLSVKVGLETRPRMNWIIPMKANRNDREIAKASFNLMVCKRYTKTPVRMITMLVNPTLKILYEDKKNPNNKLSTSKIVAMMMVVFFIVSRFVQGQEVDTRTRRGHSLSQSS